MRGHCTWRQSHHHETSLPLHLPPLPPVHREGLERFAELPHKRCVEKDDVWDTVIPGFTSVFEQYEVPLSHDPQRQKLELIPALGRMAYVFKGTGTWTVDTLAARVFLGKHLGQERTGTFNFLALPAELREVVYKLVLSYGCLALGARTPGTRFSVRGQEKKPGADGCMALDHPLTTRPLHDMLAVARVNKQLYREALPVFFSVNKLLCRGVDTLILFVDMISQSDPLRRQPLCPSEPARMQCLTSLEVMYRYGEDWTDETLVQSLTELLASNESQDTDCRDLR